MTASVVNDGVRETSLMYQCGVHADSKVYFLKGTVHS